MGRSRAALFGFIQTKGLSLGRHHGDRCDVPIDYLICRYCFRLHRTQKLRREISHEKFELGRESDSHDYWRFTSKRRGGDCRIEETPSEYLEDEIVGDPMWRQNYSSDTEHASQVIDVLNDQSKRGQSPKPPDAEARLQSPHLVVALLGAQRKEELGRVFSARVLFDGSNGIPVNRRIRLRDQEHAPVASDLKRCMRVKARRGQQTFTLTADVAEAHRQEVGGDVFTNTVGTFGIASASYYWSRVAASIERITQKIPGLSATTWHQLVADDFHPEVGRGHHRAALITFFVL